MKRPQIVMTIADHDKLRALIEEQRRLHKKLPDIFQGLLAELDRAKLKDSSKIGPDVITMNSTARVVDLETNEPMEFTLVYPDEADIEQGKISVLAPLGTAMLGFRAGDEFQWKVPAGVRRFRVDAVLFQPESAHRSAEAA